MSWLHFRTIKWVRPCIYIARCKTTEKIIILFPLSEWLKSTPLCPHRRIPREKGDTWRSALALAILQKSPIL